MYEQVAWVEAPASQFDQVVVMGEENDLRTTGELREDFQGRHGAVVVEANQQIIQNERRRFLAVEITLQARQPQAR